MKSYLTVTDQFCGAGGSSIGAEAAGGTLLMALNHWKLAIETHNVNFPNADHDCTDISACDPRRYPSTDILITSPECTNHSLAKGRKRRTAQTDLFGNAGIDPAADRSRATMWDVPRFAEYHRYNLIVVENVVDARKWALWDAWIHAMRLLGYEYQVVYLNSMFCPPTPQSRDRMYVVFWRKGNRAPDLDIRPPAWCARCAANVNAIQAWKNPNRAFGRWGRYGVQYVYACSQCANEVTPYYYAAFNLIDWSLPAERIGDRKRPLAEKTLARLRYGLDKYGQRPLIITGRYTSGLDCRVRDAGNAPLPTQPGDASHALFNPPFLVETNYSHSGDSRSRAIDAPMTTQTGQQSLAVVVPPLLVSTNYYDDRCIPAGEQPAGTQTTQTKWGVCVPAFLSRQYSGYDRPTALDEAAGTITTQDHHALIGLPDMPQSGEMAANSALIAPESIQAFMAYYYGSLNASGLDEALGTVTTVDRAGLVNVPAGGIDVNDCTFRMLQPHEIQAAMAFPGDYVVLGNKRDQVKQLGNAVTPPVMALLLERAVASLS